MCDFLSPTSCSEVSLNKMSSPSGQGTVYVFTIFVWHGKCCKHSCFTNFRGCGFEGRLSVVRHSLNFVTWPQVPHWNNEQVRKNPCHQHNHASVVATVTSAVPRLRKARLRNCGHTYRILQNHMPHITLPCRFRCAETNRCQPTTIDSKPHTKQLKP